MRPGGIGFDLLAELADENAQVVRLLPIFRAPDTPQQHAVGEHPVWVRGEKLQQGILRRRQMHFLAIDQHATAGDVDA